MGKSQKQKKEVKTIKGFIEYLKKHKDCLTSKVNWTELKDAMLVALDKTLIVMLYSGIPATGVTAYIETLKTIFPDMPFIMQYGALISAAANILAYFVIKTTTTYCNKEK